MAYKNHALVAIQGVWASSSDLAGEVFQFGVRVYTGDPSNDWLANPATYMNAIKTPVQSWWQSASMFPSNAKLTSIKVNNIKPDGHYKDTTTNVAAISAQGGGVVQNPAFVCTAVTLETGHTTGRARRGRVYLPTSAPVATGKGVSMSSADRDAARDKVKALLAILLINEPTGGLLVRPCIASRVDATINDINGVSCNDIFDVQRRRKNRALGTRSTVAAFP